MQCYLLSPNKTFIWWPQWTSFYINKRNFKIFFFKKRSNRPKDTMLIDFKRVYVYACIQVLAKASNKYSQYSTRTCTHMTHTWSVWKWLVSRLQEERVRFQGSHVGLVDLEWMWEVMSASQNEEGIGMWRSIVDFMPEFGPDLVWETEYLEFRALLHWMLWVQLEPLEICVWH